MNAFRLLVFSVIVAALPGCASTWPRPRPVACPKHHIPLQSRTMFAPLSTTRVDPSEDYIDVMTRVGDRFPYSIPFGFSGGRTDTFPVRYRVYYCSECEQGLERAFAKPRK